MQADTKIASHEKSLLLPITINTIEPIRFESKLRTVPTFVASHTFRASQDTWVSYGFRCLLKYRHIFVRFKTMH